MQVVGSELHMGLGRDEARLPNAFSLLLYSEKRHHGRLSFVFEAVIVVYANSHHYGQGAN